MSSTSSLTVNGTWTLWTFTGIRNVALPTSLGFDPDENLSLLPPSPLILSRWSSMDLNAQQQREMETVSCYLVDRRTMNSSREADIELKAVDHLFNGLMAIQVVKPTPTLGYILQLAQSDTAKDPRFGPSEMRSRMNPGQWPSLRALDAPLLDQLAPMILKVETTMSGQDARRKNSISLFQLALEHHHPAISCLLAVSSIEAILDSWKASDFEEKLCNTLGSTTSVFPDWNSPRFAQPSYTVGELAYHLHRLRSKIVHGDDLRTATDKEGARIDFGELRSFIEESQKRTYMQLLCESSICITSRLLQKCL